MKSEWLASMFGKVKFLRTAGTNSGTKGHALHRTRPPEVKAGHQEGESESTQGQVQRKEAQTDLHLREDVAEARWEGASVPGEQAILLGHPEEQKAMVHS